eukprot:gene30581-51876_t
MALRVVLRVVLCVALCAAAGAPATAARAPTIGDIRTRSAARYDGDWGKATIRGGVLTTREGERVALTYTQSGLRMVWGGEIYTAKLSAGKLVWSDGDVWERRR